MEKVLINLWKKNDLDLHHIVMVENLFQLIFEVFYYYSKITITNMNFKRKKSSSHFYGDFRVTMKHVLTMYIYKRHSNSVTLLLLLFGANL